MPQRRHRPASGARGATRQTSSRLTHNVRATPHAPRTIKNARPDKALFRREDLHADAPLHTFRERPRTHARPKPCLAATTYNARTHNPCIRSTRFENDHEPTHGRSPVWRQRLTTPVGAFASRERSRTHAWAKRCLAGRPTALVRTQSPETNTSRGRPPGMELPDYPVMATLPTPQDQDGPALPLPAGSFPVLVPRSASRRVFSRTRTSLRFPPDSYCSWVKKRRTRARGVFRAVRVLASGWDGHG
jgi:hypothetical protein